MFTSERHNRNTFRKHDEKSNETTRQSALTLLGFALSLLFKFHSFNNNNIRKKKNKLVFFLCVHSLHLNEEKKNEKACIHMIVFIDDGK